MTKITYNWKRFWYPRETTPSLTDGGYLMDPEARWGSYMNLSAQSFEVLADTPCLVLLGEPGIGKTTALTAEHAEHQRSGGGTGDTILWVDLPRYQSEERLQKAIFEHASFREWQAGSQRLYLFLDGLDECLMRMNTVADVLIEGLKQSSYERIFLRIACRTADWPLGFEEQLTQLWGDQSVKAYELAPLRRKDVVAAATTHQIDANPFLAEIDRAEAVPLSIKPVTLQMLINIYLASGALPSSRQELYEQGCLLLCEETNQHRQDTRLTGRFTANQRLAAAERIAAVTEFAYRYAIWVDVDLGNVPPADVRVRELLSVSLDEQKTVEPAIQEALATGLFSARGPQELGWAHQTYAEFLAAHFLVSRKMSQRQLMSLLTHPGDPKGKLVPQLHEVAAWLAGMQPEVFRAILDVEPEILLHSDVTTATQQDRATLVAALLQFYTDEHALDKDWSLPKHYHKLAHPGLAEQLRPFIVDLTAWVVTRRVAIEIAEACREHSLQEDLVQVALDITQPDHLRATAVGALAQIGDASVKQAIKPLLRQSAHDPNDNIKGQCLMALWPDTLTAAELFAVLTPSQREFHIGAYETFLSQDFIKHLLPGDLPVALTWAEQQTDQHRAPFFHSVVDAILLKAWDHLDTPGVLEGFARVAVAQSLQHQEIVQADHRVDESNSAQSSTPFSEQLRQAHDKRQRVLSAALPLLGADDGNLFFLTYSQTPLVTSDDLHWLLDQFQSEPSEPTQRTLALLMRSVFNQGNGDQTDAIFEASQSSPLLGEIFREFFEPMALNSREAEERRAAYRELLIAEARVRDQPSLDPPLESRIAMLLEASESGNTAAWWRLNLELTLKPDSVYYGNEFEADLTTLPAWEGADTTTRTRIIEAAKRYLQDQNPQTQRWLGDNLQTWMGKQITIHRPAFAGYRAFILLQREAPDVLGSLPESLWKQWAPMLVSYPFYRGDAVQDAHDALMQRTYQYAGPEIIETFLAQVDQENKEMGQLNHVHRVESCWDAQLAEAILAKAKEEHLTPDSLRDLLIPLLESVMNIFLIHLGYGKKTVPQRCQR